MLDSSVALPSIQNVLDVGQIAGLVWAAAKLHTTVGVVKETADDLKTSLREVAKEVSHQGERIARLEGKTDD